MPKIRSGFAAQIRVRTDSAMDRLHFAARKLREDRMLFSSDGFICAFKPAAHALEKMAATPGHKRPVMQRVEAFEGFSIFMSALAGAPDATVLVREQKVIGNRFYTGLSISCLEHDLSVRLYSRTSKEAPIMEISLYQANPLSRKFLFGKYFLGIDPKRPNDIHLDISDGKFADDKWIHHEDLAGAWPDAASFRSNFIFNSIGYIKGLAEQENIRAIWDNVFAQTENRLAPQGGLAISLGEGDKRAHSTFRFNLASGIIEGLRSVFGGLLNAWVFGSTADNEEVIHPRSDIDLLIEAENLEEASRMYGYMRAVNNIMTCNYDRLLAAGGISVASLIDVVDKILVPADFETRAHFASVPASIHAAKYRLFPKSS